MCIVLIARTKTHTIILSNRDEFLSRPTLRVGWWPSPHEHILSGRDLARPVHGTWLGITRQGRFTCLTNFREASEAVATGADVSRGEITKDFLVSPRGVQDWVGEVLKTRVYRSVGGFSLICGVLERRSGRLAVISNRSEAQSGVDYILGVEQQEDEVFCQGCEGLSNSLFGDEWPKVKLGKQLLRELTKNEIQDEDEFIQKAFGLLSYGSRGMLLT